MSDVSTTGTGPPHTVGGRYILGDLIGRGGAADVYRAHDELLGRDVAVKMFTTGGEVVAEARANGVSDQADGDEGAGRVGGADPDESAECRHRREVLTLAGLSHPGLVTVYDVGDEGGRAYFVMQLIEGDTLAQRIRAGALPVADVVALGAALADALAYVHRRGVVHRDVKPGNVLLDVDGRAHLSDFGIAAVHDAAPVTAAGMVIGTASYLSPEQVRGEPIGAGVDVYALGLVLLECLTGRREYPGNALEAAVARLHRRPATPEDLPGGLGELLDAMTADEPTGRPTAEGVVGALRGVSREVGMDAQTLLSPVLMSAPTPALSGSGPIPAGPTVSVGPGVGGTGPTSVTGGSGGVTGPRRVGVGPVSGPPSGSGPVPAPTPPRRSRRRRALSALVVALATLLLGGSAVAYAMLANRAESVPPPAATVAPGPPPVAAPPPATTSVPRYDAETTGRARRTVPTARPRPPALVPAPLPTAEAPPPEQPTRTSRPPVSESSEPSSSEPPSSESSGPTSSRRSGL